MRYGYFKTLTWKSKVKVMGEVKVQGNTLSTTYYSPISILFHVNKLSHSWDMDIYKVKINVAVKVQGYIVVLTPYQLASFSYHVNRPSRSWDKDI